MPTLLEALIPLAAVGTEHYKGAGDVHWITIHPGGGKVVHVQIDGHGNIVSGPKDLVGSQIGQHGHDHELGALEHELSSKERHFVDRDGGRHKVTLKFDPRRASGGHYVIYTDPSGQKHESERTSRDKAVQIGAKALKTGEFVNPRLQKARPDIPEPNKQPNTRTVGQSETTDTQQVPTIVREESRTNSRTFANGGQPPTGVRTTKSGHWVGGTTLQASDLSVDPARFQYKISGIDPKTGVTKELSAVKKFNPLLAGQLLVWHDPEDGKTYVVNGHHRAELAQRSPHWDEDETGWGWHGELNVQYIPAMNAKEARAMGALANIAEGRGTATDAAKFMRDTGAGVDDLASRGISLSGRIAADAPSLAGLHPTVFQSLTNGMTTEGRALAIGRYLSDADLQHKLFQEIQKKERSSGAKEIPDSHVSEMAREMDLAGKTKVSTGQKGLFGDDAEDWSESLIFQRADLKAALRRELSAEKSTFRAVSTDARVARISGAGENKLDTETNRSRAESAGEALWAFDKLANAKGELSDAIQQHADQLYHSPKQRKSILESLRKRAVQLLSEQGKGSGTGGLDSGIAAERDLGGSETQPY